MDKFKYIIISLLFLAVASGVFLIFRDKQNRTTLDNIIPDKKLESGLNNSKVNIPEKNEIKILFLGDIMLDRYIREVAMKKGNNFILEKVSGLLKDNDLAVGNLEGPMTDKESISIKTAVGEKGHFYFTIHPSWAKTLAENNIKLVNLGNNHILNFGNEGLKDTENYLKDGGIGYFGAPGDYESRIMKYELGGIKISFVSYNQFEKDEVNKTHSDISEAKKLSDFVIVYAHWGKEYETGILPNIRMLGHQFIDAGADLIIGSHPHVVEVSEEYKGKKIYYSLGNFVFDQYFSQETMKGLVVQATISPDKNLTFQEFQVRMKNNGQTEVY